MVVDMMWMYYEDRGLQSIGKKNREKLDVAHGLSKVLLIHVTLLMKRKLLQCLRYTLIEVDHLKNIFFYDLLVNKKS